VVPDASSRPVRGSDESGIEASGLERGRGEMKEDGGPSIEFTVVSGLLEPAAATAAAAALWCNDTWLRGVESDEEARWDAWS
jgi:hypothetical protein